jgi:hypothetical protein
MAKKRRLPLLQDIFSRVGTQELAQNLGFEVKNNFGKF